MKSRDKSENRKNDTGRDKVRSKMFANEKRTPNTTGTFAFVALCAFLLQYFNCFVLCSYLYHAPGMSTLSLSHRHTHDPRPKVVSNKPTIYMLKITLQFSAFIYFIYYHNLWQFNVVFVWRFIFCPGHCAFLSFFIFSIRMESWPIETFKRALLYECDCDKIKSHISTDSPYVCSKRKKHQIVHCKCVFGRNETLCFHHMIKIGLDFNGSC